MNEQEFLKKWLPIIERGRYTKEPCPHCGERGGCHWCTPGTDFIVSDLKKLREDYESPFRMAVLEIFKDKIKAGDFLSDSYIALARLAGIELSQDGWKLRENAGSR